MRGFDKSEARVFGSVVQAIFENGGADHKGGNIRLRFCASGPFVKENPREVSDGFKGFEITQRIVIGSILNSLMGRIYTKTEDY